MARPNPTIGIPSPDRRPQSSSPISSFPRSRWVLWGERTAANAVAEALGLGGTLLIGVLLFARAEPMVGPVVAALMAVVLGACVEGSIVGTAQWLVLRQPLARLRWRSWASATALGAGIAWIFGMIPSTLMALSSTPTETSSSSVQEPSAIVYYGAAAGLGFVAGVILAVAQWRVLRRFVHNASWWLPANGCAWALGMVIVFIGTGFIPASGITFGIVMLLIACVVAAGAVVGATHGLALIWLLRAGDPPRDV